ncbi:MAG: hypothetical protein MUE50_00100 [Pirellulaceae bacterium]|nr:hypothetical protein [Pirellulaceae bacterium]
MDLDALLKMLMDMFKDNPTMVLLLTVGFFLLKMIFPAPAPASSQVMSGYAERIRLALLAGNTEGAKALAEAGIAKTAEYLKEETEPKPKGILDIFTGLFTGGNLMPLLMIGGVFLLLMLTQGGGCKKASAEPVLTPASVSDSVADTITGGLTPARSPLPESQEARYDRQIAFCSADDALAAAVVRPFEWAEPLAGPTGPASGDGQGIDGPDRGGDCPTDAGVCPAVAVGTVACGSCCHGASVATDRPARQRVGWNAGPRAGPVARTARFVFRPAARVASRVAGLIRWARPLRRAGAILGFRRR